MTAKPDRHRTGRVATAATVWSCPAGQEPIPSYLGYDYVQRRLAGQGYVTVSISADAVNALDFQDADGGLPRAPHSIRDHLRAWVGFVDSGTHPADLSNVVLVGHSRGGEGVNRASLDLPADEGYHVDRSGADRPHGLRVPGRAGDADGHDPAVLRR